MISNRKVGLICVTALTGFLYCCGHQDKENKSKEKGKQSGKISMVEGVVVKPSAVEQTISVSGTIRPFEETVLMPDVAGRVITVNLPEGKFVKQGTVLVKLFDEDLQASLKKSQAQLQISEQLQNRQMELLKVNGISQSDYDQTAFQVNSYKADIELLKVQIRKTEVVAPFDGVIGLRNVSIGAVVSPSTALATIREVQNLKLDFSVPEKYSSEITPGKQIKFTVQGNEKIFTARVIATEEGIDVNTRNLNARAIIDKTTPLVPGAFANVELVLNKNKSALMVPTQAIIPRERDKQLIIMKGGKANFVTVKTGIRQSTNIEILEGLNPGDTVVTTGILFVRSGDNIKFSKVSTL
jgi:membrane fusion protein, multidrug efflux system